MTTSILNDDEVDRVGACCHDAASSIATRERPTGPGTTERVSGSCETCSMGRWVKPRGSRTLWSDEAVSYNAKRKQESSERSHMKLEPTPGSLSTSSCPPRSETISKVSERPAQRPFKVSTSLLSAVERSRLTDTRSTSRPSATFDSMEPLKDLVEVLWRDSNTSVANRQDRFCRR